MKVFSGLCTRLRTSVALAASALALSVSLGLVAAPAGASGGTIDWTGNGTNGGFCASSENIGVTVPDGEQAWLFILSSPATGPFTINTEFSPAGDTSTTGSQQGNGDGSVHFVIFSQLGAQLLKADAMTGTEHSVLTVSGCQDGAPNQNTTTTTDPGTTTTTTDPGTTTTTTDPAGGTPGDTPTGGNTAGSNTSRGGSTSGPSAPSNIVFTPNGATIVATAAPSNPMSNSGLAFTGADTAAMAAAGLALIGIGGVLILLSRDRRRAAQLG